MTKNKRSFFSKLLDIRVLPFIFIVLISFVTVLVYSNKKCKTSYNTEIERIKNIEVLSVESAIKSARQLISEYPKEPAAYHLLAKIYKKANDYNKAINILKLSIEKTFFHSDNYTNLAYLYYIKSPQEYFNFLEKCLYDSKVNHSAITIAHLYIIGGNFIQAAKHLDKTLKISSPLNDYYFLSEIYLKLNNYAKAQDVLFNALQKKRLHSTEISTILNKIFKIKKPLTYIQIQSCLKNTFVVAKKETSYQKSRQYLKNNLLKIMQQDKNNYLASNLKNKLFINQNQLYALWMTALFFQQIGQTEFAYNLLKNSGNTNIFILEEKAYLAEQAELSINEIKIAWNEVLNNTKYDVNKLISYAKTLFNHKKYHDSLNTIKNIGFKSIPKNKRILYFTLIFENSSEIRDYNTIISNWVSAEKYIKFEELLNFSHIILNRIKDSKQHNKILEIIKKKKRSIFVNNSAYSLLKFLLTEHHQKLNLFIDSAEEYLHSKKNLEEKQIHYFVKKAFYKFKKKNHTELLTFIKTWVKKLIEINPSNPEYKAYSIAIKS